MQYAVEIRNVTKKFSETVALNHINVQFEKGKIHGVIGRNGSGKTVLFKCICGLFPVTEGEIVVYFKINIENFLENSRPISNNVCEWS